LFGAELAKDAFDHEKFYTWCREKAAEGHQVFVSEYYMPDDFTCVWEKEVTMKLAKQSNTDTRVEKLFTLVNAS